MVKKDVDELKKLLSTYDLSQNEKDELYDLLFPIYNNSEFLIRMTDKFPHHGEISLGIHAVETALRTYLLSKKYVDKVSNFNWKIAVKIAMIHDLYTSPWQNNTNIKNKKFFNKHGFRHPMESIINAINWYPEMFNNEDDAKIIIDGVLHHMYPLPVIRYIDDNNNLMELENYEMMNNISDKLKEIIVNSSNRCVIGSISICRSNYLEGRIVAKADRYVSMRQIKNISSALALLTGKNKSIIKKS